MGRVQDIPIYAASAVFWTNIENWSSDRQKEPSMVTAQSVCSFLTTDAGTWSADWMFGLPLILLTVLINVLGLASQAGGLFDSQKRYLNAITLQPFS
jgi:hypothetical protein